MTPRERKPVDGVRLAAALSLARMYRQTGRPLELNDDAVADFIEALAEAREDDSERLRAAREQAWAEGYAAGVRDEQTSQEVTEGQIRPARVNPYWRRRRE